SFEAVKFSVKEQVLVDRQFVIKRKLLRHIANPSLQFVILLDNINPIDASASFSWGENAAKHPNDGRFAGTVRAQKTKDRSALNLEGNMIHRGKRAEAPG